MEKIRIGIVGYGNLGKGVELAVNQTSDMQVIDVFTRREGVKVANGTAKSIDKATEYKDKIDVMILCGGSANDLPVQGVKFLKDFNTVDSFDNHPDIPQYFEAMNSVGQESGKLGIISVGWDPGLFSMARLLFGAVLPNGQDYTFWGKGVSQGHSNAIRAIQGVADAKQYTIPVEQAVQRVMNGENPQLTKREKHIRDCYVVAKEGADKKEIERQIITMPSYFADYDTFVHFISEEEMNKNHGGLPHGGKVIRSGNTSQDNKHVLEFGLKLDSNSEFTASVLVAFARAIYKLAKQGNKGCTTAFDVPLGLLSDKTPSQLRKELL